MVTLYIYKTKKYFERTVVNSYSSSQGKLDLTVQTFLTLLLGVKRSVMPLPTSTVRKPFYGINCSRI